MKDLYNGILDASIIVFMANRMRNKKEVNKLVDQFDKDFPDLVKYGRNLNRQ